MAKKWISIFFIGTVIFFCGLVVFNYTMDPFDYWKIQKGQIDRISVQTTGNLERHIKCDYIERNGEKYNAVILGGSNAGAIKTTEFDKTTGYKSYNFWNSHGNMEDYYYLTKYCIEKMPSLKEVFVQISSEEMHDQSSLSILYALPARVMGKSVFNERLFFLTYIPTKAIDDFIHKTTSNQMPVTINYKLQIPSGAKNPISFVENEIDGTRMLFDSRLSDEELMQSVLGTNIDNEYRFENALKAFTSATNLDFTCAEINRESLQKIKSLCDENNIKLTVMIGAVFITKKSRIEGEQYYTWLRDLVNITPLHDFGGFFDANLNPYNFIDPNHYNYQTATEMINLVYGKKNFSDFGVYLTPENIESYINKRHVKLNALKQEINSTGTIKLGKKSERF